MVMDQRDNEKGNLLLPLHGLSDYFFNSIQLGLNMHSEKAVIVHACHGHTLQLSTGLSV